MKIKSPVLALVIVIIIFGGIGLTSLFDIWSTTADKTPVTYKEDGLEGIYDPSDIRGSYTFDKISTLFDIDLEVLYEGFGIPAGTDGAQFKSKDVEALYSESGVEIGNDSVQIFVALYKNLPIALAETPMPKAAVDLILQQNQQLTPEELAFLKDNQVEAVLGQPAQTLPTSPAESASEPLINGSTTIQQVLDLGVPKEKIEEILGGSLPPTNQTVKDYCSANGIPFSGIKEQLLSLISK